MDWTKNGRKKEPSSQAKRRLSIPVSPEMQKLIALFKAEYPSVSYSDTAVLSTFIEAGARTWYAQKQRAAEEQAQLKETVDG